MKERTVLVVDDNLYSLKAIIESLEIRGDFNVLQAISAKAALQILNQQAIDLIITDWEMPEMDGKELTVRIKASERTKHIPIIMATGKHTSRKDMEQAFAAGVIDYIRKPFDYHQLQLRINAVLNHIEFQQETIKAKNGQISEKAFMLFRNNEFIQSITNKIQGIISDDPEINAMIRDILNEVDLKSKEDTWHQFTNAFEETYIDFSKNLLAKHPSLNVTDIKLCVLTRLGYETKDIASILRKTPDSVKMARHRLRKKINVPEVKTLLAYLANL